MKPTWTQHTREEHVVTCVQHTRDTSPCIPYAFPIGMRWHCLWASYGVIYKTRGLLIADIIRGRKIKTYFMETICFLVLDIYEWESRNKGRRKKHRGSNKNVLFWERLRKKEEHVRNQIQTFYFKKFHALKIVAFLNIFKHNLFDRLLQIHDHTPTGIFVATQVIKCVDLKSTSWGHASDRHQFPL